MKALPDKPVSWFKLIENFFKGRFQISLVSNLSPSTTDIKNSLWLTVWSRSVLSESHIHQSSVNPRSDLFILQIMVCDSLLTLWRTWIRHYCQRRAVMQFSLQSSTHAFLLKKDKWTLLLKVSGEHLLVRVSLLVITKLKSMVVFSLCGLWIRL